MPVTADIGLLVSLVRNASSNSWLSRESGSDGGNVNMVTARRHVTRNVRKTLEEVYEKFSLIKSVNVFFLKLHILCVTHELTYRPMPSEYSACRLHWHRNSARNFDREAAMERKKYFYGSLWAVSKFFRL
jgi:hypothetical protein